MVHQAAKKALLSRRAKLLRLRAANDAGILGLSEEKNVEELAENTEISGALVTLSERERIELGEIDAALGRIQNQTWGVCEKCRARIGGSRLVALPEARTCIEHAQ